MSNSPAELLRHIRDEADYLMAESRSLDRESFLQSETLKRAFVRSIEIIGEATKKLPANVRARQPQIEWKTIAGMRDRLIHGYFAVDYGIVWDAITTKVPELREAVDQLLQAENSP